MNTIEENWAVQNENIAQSHDLQVFLKTISRLCHANNTRWW